MRSKLVNILCVQDQDGQKLVVVNPGPGEEPQTIVVPEQAETVYVIGELVKMLGISFMNYLIFYFSLPGRC